MSELFKDGFDHYGTDATLIPSYWTDFTSTNKTLVTGLMGVGKALHTQTSAVAVFKDLGVNAPTLIYGFALKITTNASLQLLAYFGDGASVQVSLWLTSSNQIAVYRGAGTALLFTSTNTFSTGVRYHVETKTTIHNTAGAFEVRVNGTSVGWVPAQTSQNTRLTANNYANRIGLFVASFSLFSLDIDDLYVFDTTDSPVGTPLKDFIGDCKILTSLADSNGDTIQFTPNGDANNYQCVAHNPPVDATNFVSDSTAGHIDLYNFTDIANIATIYSATLVLRASKSDAGARSVKSKIKSGGTVFNGTTFVLSTTVLEYATLWAVDPATSAAWTLANLNLVQLGEETV